MEAIKLTNQYLNYYNELREKYTKSLILSMAFNNDLTGNYKVFNDEEMGIENFIKLLKDNYEIIKVDYTKDNLPIKFKFTVRDDFSMIYQANRIDNDVIVMWNKYNELDCTKYSVDCALDRLNTNGWIIR